jgi:hypothetical protein
MKPDSAVLKSLAELCWKVAESPDYGAHESYAYALHTEWRTLTSRYASAGYTVELVRQMETEALDLAQRMVALAEKCLGV